MPQRVEGKGEGKEAKVNSHPDGLWNQSGRSGKEVSGRKDFSRSQVLSSE